MTKTQIESISIILDVTIELIHAIASVMIIVTAYKFITIG